MRVSVLPKGRVMLFRVTHITDYRYGEPVAEAYLELRLTPPNREVQTVREHRLVIEPASRTSGYRDYFGNEVSFLSLPYRHTPVDNPQRGPGANSFRHPARRESGSDHSRIASNSDRLSLIRVRLPATDRHGQNWSGICAVGKALPQRTNHIARGAGGSQQCDPRKLSVQKRRHEFFDRCWIHLA